MPQVQSVNGLGFRNDSRDSLIKTCSTAIRRLRLVRVAPGTAIDWVELAGSSGLELKRLTSALVF
jgi:hypothetical protein